MQYSSSVLVAAAGLITSVSAHGLLTSPAPRLAGAAMGAACGAQVLSQQTSDSYGNIQGELQVAATQKDYNAAECNIWLCKGFKFADQAASKTQSYTAGQVVPMTFDIRAPHTGYANVSIVNTATNAIIGDTLISWADFGDNSKTIPADELSFNITIPTGLESTCATAGDCVIQHFWNAASINQTYESCVDFVIGSGSSAGGSSAAAPVASSTAAAVATSAAPVEATTSAAPVEATSSAAPVATSAAAVTPVYSAVPTTLQTMVKPSSTAVVATPVTESTPAATSAAPGDDLDDCE